MNWYIVTMTHTLTVQQSHSVLAPSREEAEEKIACRWKRYPTNAKDREHTKVSTGKLVWTTTPLGEAR